MKLEIALTFCGEKSARQADGRQRYLSGGARPSLPKRRGKSVARRREGGCAFGVSAVD
jgi:hypothetical protein